MKSSIFNLKQSDKIKGGGAALAALLFLLVFIWIGLNIKNTEINRIDMGIIQWIHSYAGVVLTVLMKFLSMVGSSKAVISYIAILLLFVWFKKIETLDWLKVAGITAVSAVLNEGLKLAFHRPRPEFFRLVEETGLSFPSGHSMNGMVFFGLLAFLLMNKLSGERKYFYVIFLGLLIFSIGISRIYLGVHYPSDVIGGFCFGGFILSLTYSLSTK